MGLAFIAVCEGAAVAVAGLRDWFGMVSTCFQMRTTQIRWLKNSFDSRASQRSSIELHMAWY
jgi:hypothetical protein